MARINLRRRGTVYVLRVEIQPGLSLRKARGGGNDPVAGQQKQVVSRAASRKNSMVIHKTVHKKEHPWWNKDALEQFNPPTRGLWRNRQNGKYKFS